MAPKGKRKQHSPILPSKHKFGRSPSNCHTIAEPNSENEQGLKIRRLDEPTSSPNVSTPIKEISLYPSPSSTLTTTPAGDSSSTGTTTSITRVVRKFRPQLPATATATPSLANPDNHSSDSRKEGEVHDETHREDMIVRKLLFVAADETTEEVEPKNEIDLEIENLLKILSSSNPQLQDVAKKVVEVSMLLQKGVALMTTVRKQLLAAFTDILPTSVE